jgi:hypothetical protein
MRTLRASLLLPILGLALGGCVVHSYPSRGRAVAREAPPPQRECRPSQHWEDGHCVHNGKGRGARKHDD